MQKRKFQFAEYDSVIDELWDAIGDLEPITTEEREGNTFVIKKFRLVIPELQASFREGIWYAESDVEASDEDEYEEEAAESAYLIYAENELDINKYAGFATGGMELSVKAVCEDLGRSATWEDMAKLGCYLEMA